jgi:hypothetical protein
MNNSRPLGINEANFKAFSASQQSTNLIASTTIAATTTPTTTTRLPVPSTRNPPAPPTAYRKFSMFHCVS